MTKEELIKYVPHPKRCMATKFDAEERIQCEEGRNAAYQAWFPWEGIVAVQSVRVHLCFFHDTYRKNGGTQLGPVILRAAAEALQREKREKGASPPGRQESQQRSSSRG